jgi:hypothetical protein
LQNWPGMNRQYCPEGTRKDAKETRRKKSLSSSPLLASWRLGVLAVL